MLLRSPQPAMAGEIVYADVRHPGGGSSLAKKHRAPALCPRWHGVLLKVSGLGHLVLLVLVAVLSVQVFQGSLQPAATSAPRQGSEARGGNETQRCASPSLVRYFCEPQRDDAAACAGCKLCPQGWQLHGDRCYRLSKERGSWRQGRQGCEKQKAQLVVLRAEKEKEYLKNLTGGRTQPVWIGLISSAKKWRWVDNTALSAETLGALEEVDEGCGTLKDKALEADACDGDHQWVCQKPPFQLSGAEQCAAA